MELKCQSVSELQTYLRDVEARKLSIENKLQEKDVKKNPILVSAYSSQLKAVNEAILRTKILIDSAVNQTVVDELPNLLIDPNMYGEGTLQAILGKNVLPMGDLLKGNLALGPATNPNNPQLPFEEPKDDKNPPEGSTAQIIYNADGTATIVDATPAEVAEVIETLDEMLTPKKRTDDELTKIAVSVIRSEKPATLFRIMLALINVFRFQDTFKKCSMGQIIFDHIIPRLSAVEVAPINAWFGRNVRMPIFGQQDPIYAYLNIAQLLPDAKKEDWKDVLWCTLMSTWEKNTSNKTEEEIDKFFAERYEATFEVELQEVLKNELTKALIVSIYGNNVNVEKKAKEILDFIDMRGTKPANNKDDKAHDPNRKVVEYEDKIPNLKAKEEAQTVPEKKPVAPGNNKDVKTIQNMNQLLDKYPSNKNNHKHGKWGKPFKK